MISNLKIQVRNFKAEKKGLSDSNQSYLKKIEELESSLTKKDQLINSLRNELVKEKSKTIKLTQQIRHEKTLSEKKKSQEKFCTTALECRPTMTPVLGGPRVEFMEKALVLDHDASYSGSPTQAPDIQVRLDGIINNFMNREPIKVVSIRATTEKATDKVSQTHVPESVLLSQDSFKKGRKFWMAKVSDRAIDVTGLGQDNEIDDDLSTNSLPQKVSKKQSWSNRDIKQTEFCYASPNKFSFNVRSSYSNKDESSDIDFGIFNKKIDFESPYLPNPNLKKADYDPIEEDVNLEKKDYDEFCDTHSWPTLKSPPSRGSYPCERGQVIIPADKQNFSALKIGDVNFFIFFSCNKILELWVSA
jgi:hypothetical protein